MKIDPVLAPIIANIITAAGGIIAAAIPSVPLYIIVVILAIITLAAIFSAVIVYNALRAPNETKKEIKGKVRWIFSIIFVLTLACFIWIFFFELKIKITYPDCDGQVNLYETVLGKARNVPDEYSVWVVVYSHPDRVFYPHRSEAVMSNSGFTSADTLIGAPEDVGKQFDIIALLVDGKGRTVLQNYFQSPAGSGLPSLPPGKVYDLITVTRRKSSSLNFKSQPTNSQ